MLAVRIIRICEFGQNFFKGMIADCFGPMPSRLSLLMPMFPLFLSVGCMGCGPSDGQTIESRETPPAPPPGLVDIARLHPTIRLDIRYATANNFTGEILDGYEAPRAFLLPEAARALGRVQKRLAVRGLGLKIFDAYRPLRAAAHMIRWAKRTGNERLMRLGYIPSRVRGYGAFNHACGNTVDLTLVDRQGRELAMGTPFDHFSRKAWTRNATGQILKNRLMLREFMEAEGFRNYPREWWHYVYTRQRGIPLDLPIR